MDFIPMYMHMQTQKFEGSFSYGIQEPVHGLPPYELQVEKC